MNKVDSILTSSELSHAGINRVVHIVVDRVNAGR